MALNSALVVVVGLMFVNSALASGVDQGFCQFPAIRDTTVELYNLLAWAWIWQLLGSVIRGETVVVSGPFRLAEKTADTDADADLL